VGRAHRLRTDATSLCSKLNSWAFRIFLAVRKTVTHLRESIGAERFPHSLILAGPRGAGKYTLALMLARAFNCLESAESDGLLIFAASAPTAPASAMRQLEERVAEAVEAREGLRETDKRKPAS